VSNGRAPGPLLTNLDARARSARDAAISQATSNQPPASNPYKGKYMVLVRRPYRRVGAAAHVPERSSAAPPGRIARRSRA